MLSKKNIKKQSGSGSSKSLKKQKTNSSSNNDLFKKGKVDFSGS